MKHVAVYTGTKKLYERMVVAVKSLIYNSDVDKIYLLIEDDEFPYELPDFVECRNVSYQTYFPPDGVNMGSPFTYMAMIRAVLCYYFPDLDRILSLDVDTIVVRDISDIWDLPIEDFYFSASQEPSRCKDGEFYSNIGVCLYNLEKLRDGTADKAVEVLNTKTRMFLEQTVMNQLCQGHILDMPSEYNANRYTIPTLDPKIVHYASIKDWTEYSDYKDYEQMSWDEVLSKRNKER